MTPIYKFVPKNLDFQEQISAVFLIRNQKEAFLVTNGVRREFRAQKGRFLVTDGVRRREVAACEGAEEFPTHRNAAKKGWPEAIPFEVLVGLKTIQSTSNSFETVPEAAGAADFLSTRMLWALRNLSLPRLALGMVLVPS